jgi:hypothetical protein
MRNLRRLVLIVLLAWPALASAQSGPALITFTGGCPYHFGSNVCDSIQSSVRLQNIYTADDTLIALQVNGDTTVMKPRVTLPARIAAGDSLVIPLVGLAALEGQYAIGITATVKSGDRIQTIACDVSTTATGIHIFGWPDKPIYIHCDEPRDTALWLFAPDCEGITVNRVYSSGASPAELSLDLSSVALPITIHKLDSSQTPFEVRIPVHFNGTNPGQHTTSVTYEGTVEDGTPFKLSGNLSWIVDSGISLTPKHLTPINQGFGQVPDCKPATVTFTEQFGDSCHYVDTISNIVSQLSGSPNSMDYKILSVPAHTQTYGHVDALVVAWPFGAKETPQPGWVEITYRHGIDSSTVRYTFSGIAVRCSNDAVRREQASDFSLTIRNGEIFVSLHCNVQSQAKVELLNVLGQKVFTRSVTGNTSIDYHSLAAGVYFYRVTMGDQVVTGKIALP